ncbi:MAG: hypothetical protein KAI66_23685, partial [Lentisphaeria bacterium]|nr:hypothetical protein [Lentisphaeria bacterium]
MRDIFNDRDVDKAVARGGLADCGRLQVRLPGVFGFCGGVLRALRLLDEALDAPGDRRIWLLGEIIHNDTVNNHFRDKGARVLSERDAETIFDCASPNDTAVIPAFGLPQDLEMRVRAFFEPQGVVVDTTCGYVKRIWRFVQDMAAEHRTVLVHGKPSHPETRAILSRAQAAGGAAIVIPTVKDTARVANALVSGACGDLPTEWIGSADSAGIRRVALAYQTTMLCSETAGIEAVLRQIVCKEGGDLRSADTVCRATQDRQDAARTECAGDCDLSIVVGGFSSSNTSQLHRLAQDSGPAFFIANAEALKLHEIRHYEPSSGHILTTPD